MWPVSVLDRFLERRITFNTNFFLLRAEFEHTIEGSLTAAFQKTEILKISQSESLPNCKEHRKQKKTQLYYAKVMSQFRFSFAISASEMPLSSLIFKACIAQKTNCFRFLWNKFDEVDTFKAF